MPPGRAPATAPPPLRPAMRSAPAVPCRPCPSGSGTAGPVAARGAAATPIRSRATRTHKAVRARQGCAAPAAARSPRDPRPRETSLRPRPRREFAATGARARDAAARPTDRRRAARHRAGTRKSAAAPPIAAPPSPMNSPPMPRPDPASASLVAAPSIAAQIGRRRAQIAAIGRQSVARGPRLGRHHLEEPIDQSAIVFGHVRASASAATIRAINSCPVSRIAATA